REQFSVKIATFQAVQQMVAMMAIELEGARHATRQALWRLSEGRPADRDVTISAHQLHGGAGYVVEHVLHRHTLRAKQAELLFGSTEEWMEDLADRLKLVGGR